MKTRKILGLQVIESHVQKVSENRMRLVLRTEKNEYAVYRDTHNGIEKVYANWKSDFLEGKDKEEVLRLMGIPLKPS
jgi:leucyl aminopeptidase (aminopeptidase T)